MAIHNVTATEKSSIQECSTNKIILALQMKINREINCESVYLQISLNMDGYACLTINYKGDYISQTH